MNIRLLLVLFVSCYWMCGCSTPVQKKITAYVDPFIGTAYTGHTYPAATTPFGMVQVGPDTGTRGWEYCSGYHDKSTTIIGFSHTHLSGTGAPDMGDILFMPVIGNVPFSPGTEEDPTSGYRSSFLHSSEQASVGYYRVELSDYNILAEMTATPRVGFHQYTYPSNEESGILIDLEHGIGDHTVESYLEVVDAQTIIGMRRSKGFVSDHQYYFCARFSKPFEKFKSYQDSLVSNNEKVSGKITKLIVRFATEDQEQVQVKVGLSTASQQGAINNLDKEVPGWNFDKVQSKTEQQWERYLERVDVKTVDEDQRVSFYTSLYHSLLMPNLVTDVDGDYSGWDHKLHKSEQGDMYTNFSLWDTYRALHPFLNIMYPEENTRFVCSLLERYQQTGLLVTNEYGLCETWCMIGNHAVPVVVDAYLKGLKGINPEDAYQAVKGSLTKSHSKSPWEIYDKYGYYPFDYIKEESVSRTLESTYDDYCAAQFAKSLGKENDYRFFSERSNYYKNLFDTGTKLMRGKDSEGEWRKPFNSLLITHAGTSGGDYTEGNAWQYSWHVQHDVEGLIDLMGGRRHFTKKLDSLFTMAESRDGTGFLQDVTGLIGQYAHGNEPSHHVAYLYTCAGKPDRTAEIVRQVFDEFYLPRRDGLCGNDDCGQMSAWYIFSSLGFYPVDPISGEYIFGAPQVHEAKLNLPNGKVFTVKANNLSESNKYVKAIRLNGKQIDYNSIRYDDILGGGTLEFDMNNSAQ